MSSTGAWVAYTFAILVFLGSLTALAMWASGYFDDDSDDITTATSTMTNVTGAASAAVDNPDVRYDCASGLNYDTLRDVPAYNYTVDFAPGYSQTLDFRCDLTGRNIMPYGISGIYRKSVFMHRSDNADVWSSEVIVSSAGTTSPNNPSGDGRYCDFEGNIVWFPHNSNEAAANVYNYGVTSERSQLVWVDPDSHDFVSGNCYFRPTGEANGWAFHSTIADLDNLNDWVYYGGKSTVVTLFGNVYSQNSVTLAFDNKTPYPYTRNEYSVRSEVSASGNVVLQCSGIGDNQLSAGFTTIKQTDGTFLPGANASATLLPHNYIYPLAIYNDSHAIYYDNSFANNSNTSSNVYIVPIESNGNMESIGMTVDFYGRNSGKCAPRRPNGSALTLFASDGGTLYERVIECISE